MSRITKKGQVTIPKKIRDILGIKPNDIGIFTIKEGSILFTVKKGNILNAHRKKNNKAVDVDSSKVRELMKKDMAEKIIRENK